MDILLYRLKNIVILNTLIATLLPIVSYTQSRTEIDSIVKAKVANYVKSDISAQGKLSVNTDFNADFTNKDFFLNYKIQSNG